MKLLNGLLILPLLVTMACGEAPDADETLDPIDGAFTSDGKSDAFGITEGSPLALAILELCNTASEQTLDVDVALNVRAARAIVAGRVGTSYTTLTQLDAVPYVGQTAFLALARYVEAQGLVHTGNASGAPYENTPIVYGIQEGTYEGLAILKVANTASLAQLDVDAALDVRAAKKIVYSRGSGYANLTALSQVAYVGASVFQKLLTYARTQGMVPSCGDGAVQPVMEKCDDGNTRDGDGCDSLCRLESTCGDGLVEFAEACDDGNATSGDGCSSTCSVETKYEGDESRNRTKEGAVEIGTFRFLSGMMRSEGDVDYWKLTLTRTSKVHIDIWGGHKDGSCHGFRHDAPSGSAWSLFDPDSRVEGDATFSIYENCGSSRSERDGEWDVVKELAPGEYFIRLEGQDVGWGWDASYTVSYGIEVLVDPIGPECGNGRIEAGEACDDGNITGEDGCSRACQIEHLAEREPNSSLANNNPMGTYDYAAGNIGVGDHDYFGFKVEQAGNVTLSLNDGQNCGFDGYLELYDASGTLVAEDDDSAGNYCPGLSENLQPGTYFVNVRHSEPTMAGSSYVLHVER